MQRASPPRRFVCVVLLAVCCTACERDDDDAALTQAPADRAPATRKALFTDRSPELGLDFVHFNGMTGEYYYPEMMGGGAAMLDYDSDGDLDLYLVQGGLLAPGGRPEDVLFPSRHSDPLTDRLYRNQLMIDAHGVGRLRFEDVTPESSVEPAGYGMGVAVGDIDGDGTLDLYRTAFGANQLLRNHGHGFSDDTSTAGVNDPRWSVVAVFFDYDRDGLLDLYVGNYLDFTIASHKICRDAAGAQDYCGPTAYRGVTDRLFHNLGDGSFEDRSLESGVGTKAGKTLGALAADLDGDGWIDLYVANDGEPNFLWLNQGDGTFAEEGLWRGCAVDADGLPQASMGVDAGDFDNDGDLDLFMTHLTGEANALYRNDGGANFTDIARTAELSVPSWPLTGFGAKWIDADSDGWLDLLTLNGAVKKIEALAQRGEPYPLQQQKQLYRNLGNGRFAEIGGDAGDAFALAEVGRGAAFGDIDNDGDADVLAFNSNGPARLLLNEANGAAAWIGFHLVAGNTGQGLAGTTLLAIGQDGDLRLERASTDGSYASASDQRVLLGTKFTGRQMRYRVSWPDGKVTMLAGLEPGRYYVLPRTKGPATRGG